MTLQELYDETRSMRTAANDLTNRIIDINLEISLMLDKVDEQRDDEATQMAKDAELRQEAQRLAANPN